MLPTLKDSVKRLKISFKLVELRLLITLQEQFVFKLLQKIQNFAGSKPTGLKTTLKINLI